MTQPLLLDAPSEPPERVKPWAYDLWKFFEDEHGLILLESQLEEIICEVKKQICRDESKT